ncbi:pyridoxamine 5'-phosphate oxidase family protein [Staphylococcus simiae]|uniref:pyridoxamine 5'-phosphate oxidase family protein n=1 Tax=Staphylococcus simiae TaxID=308354 RepID=UPI001A96F79B|nr:pyridoxamine 5'-phosphate oxidase family protein [Staphylococcus simiae]MBO1199879.1 pyridoxamine 5'-phosphate oxidase family protein [Staphylococcus simiae]MBO1202137.1 pyridoxamine 5'-phosphate oxidase family protein [Staphylococcus simiae]MBO1204398.1 pyridoxamine 5'-phosphate oxidase family protein [Staphylococcus simiae]MBO1211935.1 pyridoxamine 5'-phosphate oxidase family protein [Staphylococcus simiae]MBO1230580.1 pyridoxamine 5'-phosphate oxidase family protein [Staphylococcus simia
MDKAQVTTAIANVLDTSKVGVLSTAYNNKPNSRYMVFYNDDLTLYTKTNINSTKVKEIKENPAAYVMLGYNETTNHSFVEMEATIEVVTDQKVINWLWETQDKSFFDSENDPELCVLKVVPKQVKLMNDKNLDTPVTIEL